MRLAAILVIGLCIGAFISDSATAGVLRVTVLTGPIPTLKFQPGENRVEEPTTNSYLVWMPTDYNPDRAWPVIVYLHDVGGKATLGPFREMFGGQQFIIIGLEYKFTKSGEEDLNTEVANLKHVVATVQANLKVDTKQMFLGGFGQGGLWTTMISEYTMELWAGLFTIGSGERATSMPHHPVARNKPIHIIAGQSDTGFYKEAQDSVNQYKLRGAEVTFEWIPGLGHSDALGKNEKLKSWLLENGPMIAIKSNMTKARAVKAAGHLGEAYKAFTAVAALGSTATCVEAGEAAKALAADAEKTLADAQAAVNAGKYADAIKTYDSVVVAYAGAPYADTAREALKALKTDPTKAAAAAAALESQAQAAEAAKDYTTALKLYELYLATYPKGAHVAEVKARLEAIKKDPTTKGAALEKDAERDCKIWIQMADNYAGAGRSDKAREYLEKVLDTYPGTSWAETAKAKLAKLDRP